MKPIPIDPALEPHLNSLLAVGIHGANREAVVNKLVRAQLVVLAGGGLLPT